MVRRWSCASVIEVALAVTEGFSIAQLRVQCAKIAQFRWQGVDAEAVTSQAASVLIALIWRDGGAPSILLTRRTDHLRHHAGQICLPGGSHEARDRDGVATALREFEEEVGVPGALVEVLGLLPEFYLPSGFSITPVVGLITETPRWQLDAFEVAEAFELPLAHLRSANFQRHRIHTPKGVRQVYALPYRGQFIWGATAGILAMLAAFLQS